MYDTNGRNSVMGNSLSTLTVAEFLKRVKDRNGKNARLRWLQAVFIL